MKKGKEREKKSEDACSISVSEESLRVLNRFTGEEMFLEFIKNISFTVVVESSELSDVFAYIAIDERLVI